MPSEKGKDGKWYNTAHPLTKEFRESLNEVVLQAYEEEK
jgi:DNA-binding cell septation regulator SpoVG